MKKIFALMLLLPLFSVNALDKRGEAVPKSKSKSAQTKVLQKHQRNWTQRDYGYEVTLFKCYDSWGHKLRGRFTHDEQYFIELGGGSCRQISIDRERREKVNISQTNHFDFPAQSVLKVIDQIKRDYGIKRVKYVEANRVSAGFKTFKYTLSFETKRHGYREFRVKHNRWTGSVRSVYEI